MLELDFKILDLDELLNLQNVIEKQFTKKLLDNLPVAIQELASLKKQCNDIEKKIDTLKRTIYDLLSRPLDSKFKADMNINEDSIISIYSINEYETKVIEIDLINLIIKDFKGFSCDEANDIFELIKGELKNV